MSDHKIGECPITKEANEEYFIHAILLTYAYKYKCISYKQDHAYVFGAQVYFNLNYAFRVLHF